MAGSRELGLAIAYLRGDRTQTEVAQEAGINPATWSLYEAGRRQPREASLERVLKGLGCTRLELETTAWHLRRARLHLEEATAIEAQGQSSELGVAGPELSPPDLSEESDDHVRLRLRALLRRMASLVEEILLLVARSR